LISWLFGSDTYHENNIGNGEVYSAVAQTIIDVPGAAVVASTTCPTGYSMNSFGPSGGTCALNTIPPSYCGTGYAHHAAITLAAATGGSDLTNFPALLGFNGATANSITLTNLKTVANSGQVTDASANDVIFCTDPSTGTQLAHELVSGTYTASTGAGEWYVNIPAVSHTTGATVYAFWGKTGAPNTIECYGYMVERVRGCLSQRDILFALAG